MSIDGVGKISLQAKIFPPGKIDTIDGVTKMPLQASIFVPGEIDTIDGVGKISVAHKDLCSR